MALANAGVYQGPAVGREKGRAEGETSSANSRTIFCIRGFRIILVVRHRLGVGNLDLLIVVVVANHICLRHDLQASECVPAANKW